MGGGSGGKAKRGKEIRIVSPTHLPEFADEVSSNETWSRSIGSEVVGDTAPRCDEADSAGADSDCGCFLCGDRGWPAASACAMAGGPSSPALLPAEPGRREPEWEGCWPGVVGTSLTLGVPLTLGVSLVFSPAFTPILFLLLGRSTRRLPTPIAASGSRQ